MQIINTISAMQAASRGLRRQGKSIGLVPTMGALHAGHLSLVEAARACDVAVVSIFVNPTQFGPNEDFSKYPRTFEADCQLLEDAGVDVVFAPSSEEMYPHCQGQGATFVEVEAVSQRLDGASRPGHFRGVATVVAKLFHIVAPGRAYFGQKDAAQVAVLRRMVRDLNFDLEIVVCPIVRDADGLALSSRNRYLTPQERTRALVLNRALRRIEELAAAGETAAPELIAAGRAALAEEPEVELDYLAIVDPDTLEDLECLDDPENLEDGDIIRRPALAAVAARVGTTRLIDNLLLPRR